MVNIPAKAPIIFPMGFPILIDNFYARLACLVMFLMLCHDEIKDFLKTRMAKNNTCGDQE